MRTAAFVVVSAAIAAAVASSAHAGTIATFADPAAGPSTSLFQWDANAGILTGGWTGAGLNLLTPDVPAIDYADATFQMTPLSAALAVSGVVFLSGGNIRFFDSSSVEIFRIDFSSAVLTASLSLGASDFTANNAVFSGSIIPLGYIPSNEAFAFSFANPVQTGPSPMPGQVPPSYTVTSAFTSSADLQIPAPGAAALLGLGGLIAARRKR